MKTSLHNGVKSLFSAVRPWTATLHHLVSRLAHREPEPVMFVNLRTELRATDTHITTCENVIVSEINANLKKRMSGQWKAPDDDIFALHTGYVTEAIQIGLPLMPVFLWEGRIAHHVKDAEDKLGSRIHKGAPLYNTFLCLLVAGNLDKAFQYLFVASEENFLDGRSQQFDLVLGDDGLSEQTVIKPVFTQLIAAWGNDIQSITATNLDEASFKSLIKWLGQRPTDGVQALLALHRLRKCDATKDDQFTQHLRMMALSDLVVVFESSLRRWQQGVNGELHERVTALLGPNVVALSSFEALHNKYTTAFATRALRAQPAAVNWLILQAWSDFQQANSNAARCGIATYLGLRLRNSLMHVLEDQISLYGNKSDLLRCAGIALSLLQVSKLGDEGAIAGL